MQVTQLADAGNLGPQLRVDYRLTRFAAYLRAMNGDPRKPEIVAAQTYFAIRTRQAETATPATPSVDALAMARWLLAEADRADTAERRLAAAQAHDRRGPRHARPHVVHRLH